MLIFLTVLIMGFLTVQGASVGETNDIRITHEEEPINFSTLNETLNEIVAKFQSINSELLADEYFRSANFVYGLLSRNKWDVLATTKSLKKLLKWRISNSIAQLGVSEKNSELSDLFAYQLSAVDRNGCPVVETFGGKWYIADWMDSKEFVRDAIKAFDTYFFQMLEKTRLAVKEKITTCNEGALLVVNFAGWSAKNYAEFNALSWAIRGATVWETYYPNLFKNIVLLNGNQDLVTFFNILTPHFGQTFSTFKFFKETEKERAKEFVYKLVDPEQLTLKYFDD